MKPMLRRFTSEHRSRRVVDESSNSFALFIVMLPMVLGAFGMGLDMSRNVYIRTQLQNALDLAVVGGAGVTVLNANGEVRIDPENALNTAKEVYAKNRNGSNLSCWGPNTKIPDSTEVQCWKNWGTATVNQSYLQYGVRERSKNAFLSTIGIKWQEYHIEAQARVNQAAQ